MKILVLGDVFGRVGQRMVKEQCKNLLLMIKPDFFIINGENLAGGFGITKSGIKEMFDAGVDIVTSGNHIWDKKEVFKIFETEDRLLRPANIPAGAPGVGYHIYEKGNYRIGVLNLMGRIFMDPVDCPFKAADQGLEYFKRESINHIFVDIHAEATSEKEALFHHLDGKVSALWGTHTHVPTADERVSKKGTAYITDVGMTGPYDSIIGVESHIILKRFISKLPERFKEAEGIGELNGIILEVDNATGKSRSINRARVIENE